MFINVSVLKVFYFALRQYIMLRGCFSEIHVLYLNRKLQQILIYVSFQSDASLVVCKKIGYNNYRVFSNKIDIFWSMNILYHYLCAIFGCNGHGNKETTIWCDFIKSSRCSGLLSTSKSTGSVRSNLNKSQLSFEICIKW